MPTVAAKTRFATPLVIALMAMPAWSVEAVRNAGQSIDRPADVALTAEGLLAGQVVDAQGAAVEEAVVLLYGAEGKPVVTKTNALGQFAYRGVGSGVYYLESGDQVRLTRVWPREIAPPSSQAGVLLVADRDAVRGQYGPPEGANSFVRRAKRVMTNPLAVAGIVATAVAIPVAVHNADSGS